MTTKSQTTADEPLPVSPVMLDMIRCCFPGTLKDGPCGNYTWTCNDGTQLILAKRAESDAE